MNEMGELRYFAVLTLLFLEDGGMTHCRIQSEEPITTEMLATQASALQESGEHRGLAIMAVANDLTREQSAELYDSLEGDRFTPAQIQKQVMMLRSRGCDATNYRIDPMSN